MQISTTSQEGLILEHLRRKGNISLVEAMDAFGVRSLTRRIRTLREAGFNIRSETRRHPTTGQRYVRYHLDQATTQQLAA